MFMTLQIGNRVINPTQAGELVYKVTFARPAKMVGKGKARKEVRLMMTVRLHASDAMTAVRVGKREAFSNMCDEIKFGPEFANTELVKVEKILDGRILETVRP